MMNYIWSAMMFISLIFALITGRVQELSTAVLQGATDAVELLMSILGIMCFWQGMMEIANRAGLTDLLAKLFSPVLRLLFRDVPKNSPAMQYISLNISANLLGLGNAATPFGLKAIQELQRANPQKDTASDSMLLFVVMNTASLQLFPTTLGAYRATYGSRSPFDILPCVWVSSIAALTVGITISKLFSAKREGLPLEGGLSKWR
ncbi:MAG: spore maturation protein A [Ruminococcus sp.]|nr:spore maturation protein A [Ruminococcus sp.]